jgi:preprotein translocase subunit YajC
MDLTSLLFPLLILLLFVPIFLSGRRQRRQAQEMQALQAALEPGDVVMTTSGLRGTVVDAAYEETVDLEIADGVVTTWVRAAIKNKIPAEPGTLATANDEPAVVDAAPVDAARSDRLDSTPLDAAPVESAPVDRTEPSTSGPSLRKDDSANGTARP